MYVDEKVELNETCDSCGCFAEIVTIIGEGDDVMELVIEAAAEADARAKLAAYEALAKQVTAEAVIDSELTQGANGVILMGVGSGGSPVGMSVGAGSFGRHGGGGLSVGIPTQQKRAAGVAIWVPPPEAK